MSDKHDFPRRDFLRFAAGGPLAASAAGVCTSHAVEADDAATSNGTVIKKKIQQKTQWLADKFVDWQNTYGRLDPTRAPQAISDGKFFIFCYVASAMYRAFELTGDPAHKAAADRYWFAYLAMVGNRDPKLGGRFSSARAGIGLIPYPFQRHNQHETKLHDAANSFYKRMMEYSWDEGSFLRNGYLARDGSDMDAANSHDNAASGCGMLSYYTVTKKADVLADVERLAEYFLTECVPGTYQGVWSSANDNWVIAPTRDTKYEHLTTPACETIWAWTTIEAIYFLTELLGLTQKEDLKRRIREKCVPAMRWLFDTCQFDDGACGMTGRDDKWMGLTAAAVLTFLRVRDAELLDDKTVSAYRPKALAARDWVLAHLDNDCLQRGGYYRVTGHSEPRPTCNLTWLLGSTLEGLTYFESI